jgi:hypothetical protein
MKKIFSLLKFVFSYLVTFWHTTLGIVTKDADGIIFLRYESLSIMLVPDGVTQTNYTELNPHVLGHILYHFSFNLNLQKVVIKRGGPEPAFLRYDLIRGFIVDKNHATDDVSYLLTLEKRHSHVTIRGYSAYSIA